jgi:damage-control phosphatase, subfamily I
MQTLMECIPCFVRQAEEAVALSTKGSAQRERILRQILHALADADWADSPPAIAQRLHRIIRKETNNPDPYREVKDRMNGLALEALPCCRELIATAADPQEAVVRVAVAGNLLDSGAKIQIQPENLPGLLATLWDKPLAGDPHELFRAADRAERILYLADNAGEIVFDRLLINALPTDKVTLAVRGRPILNDALRADAALAGITELVPVLDNSSDAPGTVLEDCSKEFREAFARADLIISKGQGNYETLSGVRAPLFFLFTVKCPIVAAQIGEPTGTMVATKSVLWAESHRGAQL